MSATDAPRPDVDALLARLRETVAERHRSGEYPPGLERELGEHYRRIAGGHGRDRDGLRRLLQQLDNASDFGVHRIVSVSGAPLGSQIHRTIGKVVVRQTEGVLNQVRDFADATRAVLLALVDAQPNLGSTVADLTARIDALMDRLAAYERMPDDAPGWTRELAARVGRLEAELGMAGPGYSTTAFGDRFRGSVEEITARLRPVAARFAGLEPVLDLGCGRGEMLELLRELKVEARGVDMDAELVESARSRGLDVSLGDLVAHLASAADGSLGGIYLGQVVEHLPARVLDRVVADAARKLRPGGRLIFETLNPATLFVHSHALFLDPTHVRPVHPLFGDWLVRQHGFTKVDLEWHSELAPEDRLAPIPAGSGLPEAAREVINANVERLNVVVFGPQDYTLIATR